MLCGTYISLVLLLHFSIGRYPTEERNLYNKPLPFVGVAF